MVVYQTMMQQTKPNSASAVSEKLQLPQNPLLCQLNNHRRCDCATATATAVVAAAAAITHCMMQHA
jgi:hypothetical protein